MLTTTTHRWYAVQTTAGHENKVRTLLQRRIDTDPTAVDERHIRQVMVPTQTVVEVNYVANKGTRLIARGFVNPNNLPSAAPRVVS